MALPAAIRIITKWISICAFIGVLGGLVLLQAIIYIGTDLPSYDQLAEYDPPTITRVYSTKGNVIAEYAVEPRIYTDFEDIPQVVINAFLAAEDKNFFEHPGFDLLSLVRASIQSALNLTKNKRAVGASTITQQVVRNFLLTNERTLTRKFKEIVLAYRISKVYSKERILELYLNQIFLGANSYGIAAAANNYFGKELQNLDIAEAAMLAALPKAPSALNPFSHYERAKIRRDWVIERMAAEKMITNRQALEFSQKPIKLMHHKESLGLGESFYVNAVEQELIAMFGAAEVYSKGFIVNTYLDEDIQKQADKSFTQGVLRYDKNHGWRGRVTNLISLDDWAGQLQKMNKPVASKDFKLAVVLDFNKDHSTKIGLANADIASIPFKNLQWARRNLKDQTLGAALKSPKDILSVGDVILVSADNAAQHQYHLQQIPDVDGGMIVMEPYSGAILAMIGGYDFERSYFNRALQAIRQPGSTFKTFVHLAALEGKFSPNDIVLDEPISLSQGPGMPLWTPKNYGEKYLGAITLRMALEKSRNLPTVRLVMKLGLDKVKELAERLEIAHNLPKNYSVALGAADTTLLAITNAYNTLASSGQLTKPRLIESVYNRRGKLIYYDHSIRCIGYMETSDNITVGAEPSSPLIHYSNPKVLADDSTYQITSVLEGSVQRGAAVRAKAINKTVAGKTGTTNESRDVWFIGFTPYVTAGLYLGFDAPRTLGKRETGSSVALPIFVDFMQHVTHDIPDAPFPVPDSIVLKAIDRTSGQILEEDELFPGRANVIIEAFKRDGENSPMQLINKSWDGVYDMDEIIEAITEEREDEIEVDKLAEEDWDVEPRERVKKESGNREIHEDRAEMHGAVG